MPRPIVQISQRVATITPTITDPEQKVVIVGPKYDLRVYDAEAADNSASLVIPDYAPFTGDNLASIVFNLEPEWLVDGITSPVDEVDSPPKFYIEDAEFAVVFKTASGVPSEDDNFDAEAARSHRFLSFDDRTVNWVNLKARAAAPTSFSPNVEDTIHIGHKIPSRVVFDQVLSDAQKDALQDPASTYTLQLAGAGNHEDVKVITSDLSTSSIYLHSVAVSAASAGDAAVLKVTNGADEVLVINSTLTVPADQKLHINGRVETEIELSGPIHSFPLSTDAALLLDFRVDRTVVKEFGAQVSSIEINTVDDEEDVPGTSQYTLDFSWSEADSEVTITALNAPDLRDTSIPGILNILDAACVDHVITGGKVYSTFRSLVTTQSTLIRAVDSTSVSDLALGAGVSHPLNPLGLAASVATANAGTTSVSILPISEDSVAGYTAAMGVLSGDPDVYAVIPLSDDLNNVILPYTNEAERLSQPAKSKFRIVIGASRPCPTRRYLQGSEAVNATGTLYAEGAGNILLVDPEASFLASGVTSTSKMTIGEADFTVGTVLDDSRVRFTMADNPELAVHIGNVEYTISTDISTDRAAQVDVLTSRLGPITSKRLVMVYPGTCSVQGHLDLPGYYLSSAVGGMLAVFEPHRPKNNILLAGVDSISTSNLGFFTDTQIDTLSDSGYFVLVQDTSDGALYCVHQVTVAYEDFADTQELSELSVLNNFDYVSKYLGKALSPFVGSWNVTPQAISTINASLDAALIRLQSQWTDVIGSPVINYTIQNVSVSESSRGTINVSVAVTLPRVLNTIFIEIVSE
jgi:hypothetical protein